MARTICFVCEKLLTKLNSHLYVTKGTEVKKKKVYERPGMGEDESEISFYEMLLILYVVFWKQGIKSFVKSCPLYYRSNLFWRDETNRYNTVRHLKRRFSLAVFKKSLRLVETKWCSCNLCLIINEEVSMTIHCCILSDD